MQSRDEERNLDDSIPSVPFTKTQESDGRAEMGAGGWKEAFWGGDMATSRRCRSIICRASKVVPGPRCGGTHL